MIGQPGRHGGSALQIALASPDGVEAQAVVGPAPVVDTADEPHPTLEQGRAMSGGAAATDQRRKLGAQECIEPLDVGRVDRGAASAGKRLEDGLLGPDHDAAHDVLAAAALVTLDDLGEQEALRPDEPGPAAASGALRDPEDRPGRRDIGGEAIDAEEKGGCGGTGADPE